VENTASLIKKYDKLLSQHPGKWVAISDESEVIATSENIEELTERVKQLNDFLFLNYPAPTEKKIGYLL